MKGTRPRWRGVTMIMVMAPFLLLPACGGSHRRAASTSTTAAGAALGGGSGPTTTAASGGPGATSGAGAAAGHASPSATAASTVTSAAPNAGSVAGGPAPIAAGTYQYHQTGTVTYGGQQQAVPATGTLVADPAKPDRTQVVHRQVSPSQVTDFTFSFTNGGIFVLSSTQHAGQTAVTCTFSSPLPVPPWPPAAGQHFSGAGSCDYAGESVAVSGTVGAATAGYAVPGLGPRTVWEVDLTITTKGPAAATDNLQELFSPDLRLPVETNEHVSGSFGLVQFSSAIQSQLVSGPA